jgi:hypothetical protein
MRIQLTLEVNSRERSTLDRVASLASLSPLLLQWWRVMFPAVRADPSEVKHDDAGFCRLCYATLGAPHASHCPVRGDGSPGPHVVRE